MDIPRSSRDLLLQGFCQNLDVRYSLEENQGAAATINGLQHFLIQKYFLEQLNTSAWLEETVNERETNKVNCEAK